MSDKGMNILMVGDVILSIDCLKERFCCDVSSCKGQCCIEGDAGAPITEKESKAIAEIVPVVWEYLSPQAREIISRQGVSYIDQEGDLVTSIVNGRDCVFTCYDEKGVCLCAIQKARMEGKTKVDKPISCSLYPLREKRFSNGLTGLNYHRWDVCQEARCLGKRMRIPVYKFLKEPLISRFGMEWYSELEKTVEYLQKENLLDYDDI